MEKLKLGDKVRVNIFFGEFDAEVIGKPDKNWNMTVKRLYGRDSGKLERVGYGNCELIKD